MMGHLQGQAVKLHLSVINPFALFSEVAAAPSGCETSWEEEALAAQAESPGLSQAVWALKLERAAGWMEPYTAELKDLESSPSPPPPPPRPTPKRVEGGCI